MPGKGSAAHLDDACYVVDSGHGISSEDLAELEYLDRFVKEVMRLHPSVPFIARVRA